MTLNVHGLYTFNGPFTEVTGLQTQSGVYLISIVGNDGSHTVLDIGESANVHNRVKTHDRKDQWNANSQGRTLHVSSYYCDEANRMLIESHLRGIFNPVCGVR